LPNEDIPAAKATVPRIMSPMAKHAPGRLANFACGRYMSAEAFCADNACAIDRQSIVKVKCFVFGLLYETP
jgi:hypothetical protein